MKAISTVLVCLLNENNLKKDWQLMSRSVNGDVERITLAPGVERVDTTVRILETEKSHVRRVVSLLTIWGLLLIVAPAYVLIHAIAQQNDNGVQLESTLFAFCFLVWVGVMCSFFGGKEHRRQERTETYSTVSFPVEYFEAYTQPTIDGPRNDLVFSELGETKVPISIRELVYALDVDDAVASFVKRGEGRIVFLYNAGAKSILLHVSRVINIVTNVPFLGHDGNSPKNESYIATINGELLPREGAYYALPDDLLSTSELLRIAK